MIIIKRERERAKNVRSLFMHSVPAGPKGLRGCLAAYLVMCEGRSYRPGKSLNIQNRCVYARWCAALFPPVYIGRRPGACAEQAGHARELQAHNWG